MSDTTDKLVMVRVLGPVDVVVSGDAVTIGSRLERLLLAAFVESANQAVSTNRLAEILWGAEPPPSRDNTLQTYISRLRATVGGARIATEGDSYILRVAEDEVDAGRFEHLVGAAAAARDDPERCRRLCDQALSLWRGSPFGAFTDDDPFRLNALRLDGIRLFALELNLGSEIALGNEALAVGPLEALVADYPYRERLWHLLVVALSLSGRRVEALRACTDLRQTLAALGLEPTLVIRDLEDEIATEAPDVRSKLQAIIGAYST